jgi:hypothetical protein
LGTEKPDTILTISPFKFNIHLNHPEKRGPTSDRLSDPDHDKASQAMTSRETRKRVPHAAAACQIPVGTEPYG